MRQFFIRFLSMLSVYHRVDLAVGTDARNPSHTKYVLFIPNSCNLENHWIVCIRAGMSADVRVFEPRKPGFVHHGKDFRQETVQRMDADGTLDARFCKRHDIPDLVADFTIPFLADNFDLHRGNSTWHTALLSG